MRKWHGFVGVIPAPINKESVKIPGAIRSCGLRFSFAAESRIPAPEGLLEVAVENFGSSL